MTLDAYRTEYATLDRLAAGDDLASVVAAGWFVYVVDTRAPAVVSVRQRVGRTRTYIPNLQDLPTAPTPEVGDPLIELVSPLEGEPLPSNGVIVVRASNKTTIANRAIILYVAFGEPSDNEASIRGRDTFIVHDGDGFFARFDTQDSSVVISTEGDRTVRTYTIPREGGWPVGARAYFFGRMADATGETV